MKEKDYINATNISKTRIAKNIIRDMLFEDEKMAEMQVNLIKGLRLIEEYINKEIRT